MNQEHEQQGLFPENITELEQEVNLVVDREYSRTQDEYEEHFISKIKNKHEGYGHTAERFVTLEISVKRAKDDMKDFLAKLPEQSDTIVRDTAGNLYGHAIQIAQEAVTMAAVAKRVVFDILANSDNEELPMEAFLNDSGDENDLPDDTDTVQDGEDLDYEETEN